MSGGPLLWNAVEVEMLGLALGVYLLFNIGLVHDHVRLVLAHIGWSVLLVGKVRLIMNHFIVLDLSYLLLNLVLDRDLLLNILQHSWDWTMLAEDLSFDHLLLINELHALGHLHVRISPDNFSELIKLLLHLLLLRRFWLPEQSVRNVRLLLGLGLGHGDAGEDVTLVDGELVFGPSKWIFLVRGLVEAGV